MKNHITGSKKEKYCRFLCFLYSAKICTFAPVFETMPVMKNFYNCFWLFVVACVLASCSSFVAIERAANIVVTEGNRVQLLNGAKAKFEDMFAAIREAKHHVHLEYFNFRNDSINAELIGLLADKAKEGLEVRAMFDAFGNMSNNKPLKQEHIDSIRAAGVELVRFDPVSFPWVNHSARDHRKIVVIDGKVAYIGGINVADYYLQGLEGIGKWRDIHARVEGPAVAKLQDVFLAMWNGETGQQIGGEAYYPSPVEAGDAEVAVVDRKPRTTPKAMRRAYANAINSAKDSVVFVSPYFLPTPLLKKAIKKAIDDGLKVDVMLTAKGDIPMVPDGVWRVGYKLMKRGANVYMYDGGFNHSKVMCVDGKFMTVGSANLNSRSMHYDYETNIFVFDKSDTRALQNIIDEDKKESFLLTKEIYKKRSLWRRICGFFVVLATPIM